MFKRHRNLVRLAAVLLTASMGLTLFPHAGLLQAGELVSAPSQSLSLESEQGEAGANSSAPAPDLGESPSAEASPVQSETGSTGENSAASERGRDEELRDSGETEAQEEPGRSAALETPTVALSSGTEAEQSAQEARSRRRREAAQTTPEWTLDPAAEKGDETLSLEEGWWRFASSSKNGNSTTNPAQYPAIAIFKNEYDFSQAGQLELTIKANKAGTSNRFGFYLGYKDPNNGLFIGYDAAGWFWQRYGADGQWMQGARTAAPAAQSEQQIQISWDGAKATLLIDQEKALEVDYSSMKNLSRKLAIKGGTYGSDNTDVSIRATEQAPPATEEPATPAKLIAPEDMEVLQNAELRVNVFKKFPLAVDYELLQLGKKKFHGQVLDQRLVAINGQSVELGDAEVQYSRVSDVEAQYILTVKQAEQQIDAQVTARLRLEGRALHFDITAIENKAGEEHPVQTLSFPQQSLISIRSNQAGAQFSGALMSSDTTKPGDEHFSLQKNTEMRDRDYTYAFISADGLSAGLWSNSEHDGRAVAAPVRGGSQNTRIMASTQQVEGEQSLGLTSAPWFYHRRVKDSRGRSYIVPETDMPKSAVIFAADENGDGQVNWQDGAVAYRSIMNNPYKSEEVPELVAWRIAMNFGSHAQNPFLTTLDNVKKVALHTDGLGQSVLLKGYGSEGHDSGHPDYGDIGFRIGGAKDMNTLMREGRKLGARFGVHVNASEMYPEAKAFSDELVRRRADGSLSYGWNWLDQGIGIDGIYDLATGAREQRFQELKDQVGDHMDFIYLDVWGNLTSSGSEDSWETRKMSKMINDRGWRMTTEWGPGNEYDSTFQHWATDLTYGGKGFKGANSQIMRFLRNHQKDSWVGDYPSYGGAANAPLLGGYNMKDFEGWQGRNDYDAYIKNLYTHDLSTKFIQHFQIQRWVNNPLLASTAEDPKSNGGNEEITLADRQGNSLVIRRGSNDQGSSDYRLREMLLNGKTVSRGRVSRGDNGSGGDEAYLLPWLWDAETGTYLAGQGRLYHWNTQGGQTSWDLPEDWKDLSSVTVYELTDLGKAEPRTVPVSGGQLRLDAKAATPYVIYKQASQQLELSWSDGMHIVDAGFNAGPDSLQEHWLISGEGTASIQKSQHANPMLLLEGTVKASQELRDLQAGQRYALYVGLDKRGGASASLRVLKGSEVLASNQSGRSIARNYVKAYSHNTRSSTVDGSSYFQNMYVFFTAPEGGEPLRLELGHEGEGQAYFDDVRVVANDYRGLETDENGALIRLSNDFEQNVQGIWPFVVSASEGVEDNRIHLSEIHAPFTQAGWDVKKMDDVLQGRWSVKINGLSQKNTLIYQTIPQNLPLAPGRRYRVSFDYQSGSEGIYAFALGHGEFSPATVSLDPLPKALGSSGHYETEVMGSLLADSWIGIFSTSKAPDLQGTRDAAANFGGYKDFVLDNLVVELIPTEEVEQSAVEDKLAELQKSFDEKKSGISAEARQLATASLIQARVLLHMNCPDPQRLTKALELLRALEIYLDQAPSNAGDARYDIPVDSYSVEVGSFQPNYANVEGPAEYAQDAKTDTYWHSQWGVNAIQAKTAWYQFNFKQAQTVDGLRYLPRPGGANVNGKILKYKIVLTLADQSEREIVTEGRFTAQTQWQKVNFGPVENVTKLRLVVLESAGQTPSQVNNYAAAAELRVTQPGKDEDSVPVDTAELKTLAGKAQESLKATYSAESREALEKALKEAQAVLDQEAPDAYAVALALANLRCALTRLNPSAVPDTAPTAPSLPHSDFSATVPADYPTQPSRPTGSVPEPPRTSVPTDYPVQPTRPTGSVPEEPVGPQPEPPRTSVPTDYPVQPSRPTGSVPEEPVGPEPESPRTSVPTDYPVQQTLPTGSVPEAPIGPQPEPSVPSQPGSDFSARVPADYPTQETQPPATVPTSESAKQTGQPSAKKLPRTGETATGLFLALVSLGLAAALLSQRRRRGED